MRIKISQSERAHTPRMWFEAIKARIETGHRKSGNSERLILIAIGPLQSIEVPEFRLQLELLVEPSDRNDRFQSELQSSDWYVDTCRSGLTQHSHATCSFQRLDLWSKLCCDGVSLMKRWIHYWTKAWRRNWHGSKRWQDSTAWLFREEFEVAWVQSGIYKFQKLCLTNYTQTSFHWRWFGTLSRV